MPQVTAADHQEAPFQFSTILETPFAQTPQPPNTLNEAVQHTANHPDHQLNTLGKWNGVAISIGFDDRIIFCRLC